MGMTASPRQGRLHRMCPDVDHESLVAGLNDVLTLVDATGPGLPALEALVATARVALGADGATFSEYADTGGRVIVADGSASWALGSPIPELTHRAAATPALHRTDRQRPDVVEHLLGRGIGAIAGGGVLIGGQVRGAVHFFYKDIESVAWEQVRMALRLVAEVAARAYPEQPVAEAVVTAPDEQEDRALFLAVAGHALRTPVTVLKGYASMLARRWDALDEADRRDAAEVMAQRADELARLVGRLLSASLGDGGDAPLLQAFEFEPVQALRRAVADAPAEIRSRVQTELPDRLPLAWGDPVALEAIVAELVNNAVRYTAGSGPVEISAEADAQTVAIQVADRGVGIDASEVEHAFERFWRGRPDLAPRGVGLGLFLVRRLVERQNGWVSLRPRDGGGTVAEVRLPRADGPLRRPAPGEA
jgi:signal transduction histidine kinase